ncbi:DUF397 domain-containing protein [Streptomyces venezuelae]|uniref:DUF397 domain-containing protein n=1 Tax=Streptomyces venezuelae TaxID=54571 RepID=A0A5P2D778_STRVZ|nr:DUF397 domain-containing protein [Streptomyces venezuelae]QES50420.1 DUF397 domain-containing protein [Streptomyces venezuelae]
MSSVRPPTEALSQLVWVKSSYSSNDGPDCVEVAGAPGAVLVRDSKRPHDAPYLSLSPAAWGAFLGSATAHS